MWVGAARRIVNSLRLKVPTPVATLHDFACQSRHSSDNDFQHYCETLRLG